MPRSWDSYVSMIDEPETCPICQKPSSKGRNLKPFCCTAHRDQHVRALKRTDAERVLLSAAQPGQLGEEDGVVHRVAEAFIRHNKDSDVVFTGACKQQLGYPRTTTKAINCLGCIAEGAHL